MVAAAFIRKATIDLSAALGAITKLYRLTPTQARMLRGIVGAGLPLLAGLSASPRPP